MQSLHLSDEYVQIQNREGNSKGDDGSVSSHDSILEATGMEHKMQSLHLSDKYVQIQNREGNSKGDDGSVSSHDSILEATGMEHKMQSLHLSDKYVQIQNREGNSKGDDSSVSSHDSILEISGIAQTMQSSIHKSDKPIEIKEQQGNSKGDDSSVSSNDSILEATGMGQPIQSTQSSHRPVQAEPISRRNKAEYQDSNCDDSSVPSDDSIMRATGFERKKHPIHSYYDFCKYYPDNSKRNAPVDIPLASESSDNSVPSKNCTIHLPPEVPLPINAHWSIVLLMDHREFGCSNNFLSTVETQINKHFGGKHAEITTLPSADYLYVARLISTAKENAGEILDERVLDLLIERKAVQDVCQCLITDSKKYKPLSFFEAQMYKLMNCGMSKKLFVMEGNEDKTKGLMHGAKSQSERERRLKRVKTLR